MQFLSDSPGTESHNQALFPPALPSPPRRKILRRFRPVSSIDGATAFRSRTKSICGRSARRAQSTELEKRRGKREDWNAAMVADDPSSLHSCGNNDNAALRCPLFRCVCFGYPTIFLIAGSGGREGFSKNWCITSNIENDNLSPRYLCQGEVDNRFHQSGSVGEALRSRLVQKLV